MFGFGADLHIERLENCSFGGSKSPTGVESQQLAAGGHIRSHALASQGTGSQAFTKSFSKGMSASESEKKKKESKNWIDKSNEARLRDLRATRECHKRKSRVASSFAVRKPNAVVKAHHNIVPRFPKPRQVCCSHLDSFTHRDLPVK
jgi:hypothetical protein